MLSPLVCMAHSSAIVAPQFQETQRAFAIIGGFYLYDEPIAGEACRVFILPREGADKALGRLPKVPFAFGLYLGASDVSNDGLRILSNVQNLRYINLSYTNISDISLLELLKGTELTSLDISHTAITDVGLMTVGLLKSLRHLYIDTADVTDAVLKSLASCESLVSLHLGQGITNAGLREIKNLRRLRSLSLRHTSVTDAGLKHIEDSPRIEVLQLSPLCTDDAIVSVQKKLTICVKLIIHIQV